MAALGGGIYKGRFIARRGAFVNVFNKKLVITVRRGIVGNKAFNSIYNRKLIIIIKKYL